MKKILLINGSPKGTASDTMHLASAFIKGMEDEEALEVSVINTYDAHIRYCTGCFACMKNGGKCVIDDDMASILKQILSSDVLVFSFPLYCYGMPASLKALLDRTLPMSHMTMEKTEEGYEHTAQSDFSHLRYVMICGSGFPSFEGSFDAVSRSFISMFPREKSTLLCVSESPMFSSPEASSVTIPFLAKVRASGAEYAKSGTLSAETLHFLSVPMIPPEQYIAIVNGEN